MRRRFQCGLAGVLLIALSGCEPFCPTSVHGLLGDGGKADTSRPPGRRRWFGADWERVEWRIEASSAGTGHSVTHFGPGGKKSYFSASLVTIGDLRLMDLSEADPGEKRHVLIKFERSRVVRSVSTRCRRTTPRSRGSGPRWETSP